MALIIEDGTGVANANSFKTVAQLRAFGLQRGVTLAPADATVEVYLVKAMDFLNIQAWQGEPTYVGQMTPFPRMGLEGYDDNEIPGNIGLAQMHLALAVSKGVDLMPTQTKGAVKRKKVGPIETEYFGGSPLTAYLPQVSALISDFVGNGLGGQFRVERA